MVNHLFPILRKSVFPARSSRPTALWLIAPVAMLCVAATGVYLMRVRKRRHHSPNCNDEDQQWRIEQSLARSNPGVAVGGIIRKVSSPTFTAPIRPVVSRVQNQGLSRSHDSAVTPVFPPRRVPGQGKHRRLALVIAAIVSSLAIVYAAVGPIRSPNRGSDSAEAGTPSAMFTSAADDAEITPEVSESQPMPQPAEPAPPAESPDDARNATFPAPSPASVNASKKKKHSRKHRTQSRKRSQSAHRKTTGMLPTIH